MRQILCFGDSNTYGLIPGEQIRYLWEERWTGRLESYLQPYGIRVIEEGLCGRTTEFEDKLRSGRKGLELLPVLLESHCPLEGIIIMLGTNDCKTIYNASAEVIGKGIEKLINQVKTISPDLNIYLISPIWLGEDVWREEYDPEFNKCSVETSKKLKAVYISIAEQYGCEFLAASDYVKVSNADMEHMDAEGHRVFAEVIYDKLGGKLINGF